MTDRVPRKYKGRTRQWQYKQGQSGEVPPIPPVVVIKEEIPQQSQNLEKQVADLEEAVAQLAGGQAFPDEQSSQQVQPLEKRVGDLETEATHLLLEQEQMVSLSSINGQVDIGDVSPNPIIQRDRLIADLESDVAHAQVRTKRRLIYLCLTSLALFILVTTVAVFVFSQLNAKDVTTKQQQSRTSSVQASSDTLSPVLKPSSSRKELSSSSSSSFSRTDLSSSSSSSSSTSITDLSSSSLSSSSTSRPTTSSSALASPGELTVEVTVSDLDIRQAPNLSAQVLRLIPKGTYTIVETKQADGHLWGRLKSGEGWISLTANAQTRTETGVNQLNLTTDQVKKWVLATFMSDETIRDYYQNTKVEIRIAKEGDGLVYADLAIPSDKGFDAHHWRYRINSKGELEHGSAIGFAVGGGGYEYKWEVVSTVYTDSW